MDRPAPDDYQPRLTWWGRTWRLLAMLLISALAWVPVLPHQSHPLRWVDVGVGLTAYAVITVRRRQPVAVALVACLLNSVSAVASGPAVIAAASVASRRRWREIVPVGVVGLLGQEFFAVTQPANADDPFWLDLSINAIATTAVLAWGMYVGSRRELLCTLEQRAERAEAEQELRTAQARSTERARIAREMHDVLAHRISQISLHAGALAFREDLTSEDMRSSAAVIQERAHEALTDLRGVLGVLRDGDGGPLETPQPTYDDLPDLVEDARRSGLTVTYRDGLADGAALPEVVGRTIYRIVQEGITNARKHAPGSRLTIELTGSPDDGVDVVLRNPLGFGSATPGAGLGLVGLTERAQLRGGRLEHRRDGASFVLHGWIPWAA